MKICRNLCVALGGFLALALNACGGSGGGDAAPAPYQLSFAPGSLTVSYAQGTSQTVSVTATLDRTVAQPVYVGIVDSVGVIEPTVQVSPVTPTSYQATLTLKSTLSAGEHAGSLQVRLCHDSAATCNSPLPGSPFSLPYTFTVTPMNNGGTGCGSAAKFATGLQSITSDGIERSYWVEMPANYDNKKAYPVIIGLHPRGSQAINVYQGWNRFFGLKDQYGDNAILLAPDGLNAGWGNDGDRDIRFMRAMLSQVQQGACTDTQRVFATGFSFGGMMSNAIGCQMGDVVRAIVPMSGSLWSGCASSNYKVAALFTHDKGDDTVPYSAGEAARDEFLKRNHCSATTVPVGSNGCVEYQGCDADKPVVWCATTKLGHWYPQSFSAQESKSFFDRFK